MKKCWIPLIGVIYASELPSIKFWNGKTIAFILYHIAFEILVILLVIWHIGERA
jgi:hypothetical protein